MLPILPAFLLVILAIYLPAIEGRLNKTKAEQEDVPKQVTFNEQGILVIDANIHGTSDPITVDRKPLINMCGYKPYYRFTICPKSKQKFKEHQDACPKGVYLCYEGQLTAHRVREQFVLPRVNNEISANCKEFNGFKVALHYLNSVEERKLKPYLEVGTSFTEEPYFYPLPDSLCIDLALGSPSDLLAGVRTGENDDQLIRHERVKNNSKEIGFRKITTDEEFDDVFGTLPGTVNNGRYRDEPHLKMLYLDFRAYYYTPQMMLAIVPESCNMQVRIRSNVLETCKSDFKQKNFALRSLNDANVSTEYALTVESGTEDWKTTGNRRSKSSAKSESTETAGSTTETNSDTSGLQKERESIHRNSDTHTETSGTESKSEKGARAFASGEFEHNSGGLSAQARAEMEASINQVESSGSTDMYTRFNTREGRESHSETTSTTKTSILETFHRNTQTSINTQKQQSFNSHSVGIQKRTVFKWIVKVPPGKVMTPMQMTVDCDGAKVQIPQLKFVVSEEGDELLTPDYEEGNTL